MSKLDVEYFSDVLCVWAFINEYRLSEVEKQLGDSLDIHLHFLPNFASVQPKIANGWKDKGGFSGYADHVIEVAEKFEIKLHDSVWRDVRPNSSIVPHSLIKAAEITHSAAGARKLSSLIRNAFFLEGQDIGQMDVCLEVAESMGLDEEKLLDAIDDGQAMSALFEDFSRAKDYQISVSPAWVFNEGRQKLIGNVGYRVIEANLKELIETKPLNQLWC